MERVSPTPHEGELAGHEQGGFVFMAKGGGTAVPKELEVMPTTTDLPGMVFVKGGSFDMGDQFSDGTDGENPFPVHTVNLSDFFISDHEVTNTELAEFLNAQGNQDGNGREWYELGRQYAKIKKTDGGYEVEKGFEYHPTMEISWYGAIAYCNWKSEQDGLQKVYTINGGQVSADWRANGYRLPTKAEWEYAARSGGQKEKWAGTSSEAELQKYCNDNGSDDGYVQTAPVKSLQPNSLGLYDMSGNVWEWCWDWSGSDENSRNSTGPATGSYRAIRGGSWSMDHQYCRTFSGGADDPMSPYTYVGFRLALSSR